MSTVKTPQPGQRTPARPSLAHNPQLLSLENHVLRHLYGTQRKPEPEEMAEWARKAAPDVKALWDLLNISRPRKLPLYMERSELSNAYLTGFFLPNVARIQGILGQREVSNFLETQLGPVVSARHELRIVDHGAGPLTATFSLLFWLQEHFPDLREGEPLPVRVYAVEASHSVLVQGRKLMENWSAKTPFVVEVEKKGTKELTGTKPHLVVSANALNELSSQAKEQLVHVSAALVSSGAGVLMIEPGQDKHAWNLAHFRDTLLAQSRAISVAAPCCHRFSCPLGPESGRKDWCWFGLAWKPTPWMKALDSETGLRHTELNFSYVLFTPGKAKSESEAPWGRIVSDIIPVPEEKRARTMRYLVENPWPSRRGHAAKHRGTPRLSAQPGAQERSALLPRSKQLICADTGDLLAQFVMSAEPAGTAPVRSAPTRGPRRTVEAPGAGRRGDAIAHLPPTTENARLCQERSAADSGFSHKSRGKVRAQDRPAQKAQHESDAESSARKTQPKRRPLKSGGSGGGPGGPQKSKRSAAQKAGARKPTHRS